MDSNDVSQGESTGRVLAAMRAMQNLATPQTTEGEYTPWKFHADKTILPFPLVTCPLCAIPQKAQVIYLYSRDGGLVTMRFSLGGIPHDSPSPASSMYSHAEGWDMRNSGVRIHPHLSDRGRLCFGDAETASEALTTPSPRNAYFQPNDQPVSYDKYLLMDLGHDCPRMREILGDFIDRHIGQQLENGGVIHDFHQAEREDIALDALRTPRQYYSRSLRSLKYILDRHSWLECFDINSHMTARHKYKWHTNEIGGRLLTKEAN